MNIKANIRHLNKWSRLVNSQTKNVANLVKLLDVMEIATIDATSECLKHLIDTTMTLNITFNNTLNTELAADYGEQNKAFIDTDGIYNIPSELIHTVNLEELDNSYDSSYESNEDGQDLDDDEDDESVS